MRHILAAALIFLAASAAALMPPLKLNFQGKLTDPVTGNPRNGSYNMTFRLYRAPSGGAAVFGEFKSAVPVNNGVFSVQLGSDALLSRELFAQTSAFLSVEIGETALDAGGDGEMTPRQQLVMSPYAYTAVQLMNDGPASVNAGVSYATFTSAGNWLVPYGVVAATGAFDNVTAGSATVTGFGGVEVSSGVRAQSLGLRYGVSAASASFTAAGGAQFSVESSSGVRLAAGTLLVQGTGGVDAPSVIATAATLRGSAADGTGSNGKMIYNSTTDRFRCYEEGAWHDCLKRTTAVSFGNRQLLSNVGGAYDTTSNSRGLGIGVVDFTGAISIDFRVFVQKVGTGTQDWQLYNETDGLEIGVLSDAGGAAERVLTGTFTTGLPTGVKQVRVRARSSNATDDPVYLGAAMLVSY